MCGFHLVVNDEDCGHNVTHGHSLTMSWTWDIHTLPVSQIHIWPADLSHWMKKTPVDELSLFSEFFFFFGIERFLRFVEKWKPADAGFRHFRRFGWKRVANNFCNFLGRQTVDVLTRSKFVSADNSRRNSAIWMKLFNDSTECRNRMKLAAEGESNVLITKVKIWKFASQKVRAPHHLVELAATGWSLSSRRVPGFSRIFSGPTLHRVAFDWKPFR